MFADDIKMQPNVVAGARNPGNRRISSFLEIPRDGETRRSLEEIAQIEGKLLLELEESLLATSGEPAGEAHGDPAVGDDEEIGERWAKLTNEILRLECRRCECIRLLAERAEGLTNPAEHLQCLLEILASHDRKVRQCEDQLEDLMARRRKRSPVCGVLTDDCGR
jgi:hypothetical protein